MTPDRPNSVFAAAEEPARQPSAAPAQRAEAAVLLGNEVAVNRASTRNALEAHTLEDSHATCCHRSGEQGIADLHPPARRSDRRGAQFPTRKLPELVKTWPTSRVVMEASAEAFKIADAALAAGHEVRVVPGMLTAESFRRDLTATPLRALA